MLISYLIGSGIHVAFILFLVSVSECLLAKAGVIVITIVIDYMFSCNHNRNCNHNFLNSVVFEYDYIYDHYFMNSLHLVTDSELTKPTNLVN